MINEPEYNCLHNRKTEVNIYRMLDYKERKHLKPFFYHKNRITKKDLNLFYGTSYNKNLLDWINYERHSILQRTISNIKNFFRYIFSRSS
jgi:ribosomal protein S18